MAIVTTGTLILIDHSGPTTDPNLATVGEVAVAMNIDSAAVSTATSKMVSTANAQVPDSSSISSASSKAGSAGTQASTADSKAVSGSTTTSVADSKALSVSGNTSIADSKATSVGTATIVPTVGGIPGFLQSGTGAVVRTANSKMAEIGYSIRDFGANGGGINDDSAALTAAATAAGVNGAVLLPPGTYRIAANVTLSCGVIGQGGLLKPDAGKTVAVAGFLSSPASRVFDVSNSGAVVTVSRANPDLYSEWWGAHSVVDQNGVDDTNAALNTAAVQAATNCLNGNGLVYLGMYTVTAAITHPNTSFTLRAGAGTQCGLKPATTTPNIDLFDFTGCNGPQIVVDRLQGTGPVTGLTGNGTAFKTSASNGISYQHCWARGINVGFNIDGSFISGRGCATEFCTTGIKKTSTNNAAESFWVDTVFFRNGTTDIELIGDCYGLTFLATTHTDTGNGIVGSGQCWKVNGVTGLTVGIVTTEIGANKNDYDIITLYGASADCHFGRVVANAGRHGVLFQDCVDCSVDHVDAKSLTGNAVYFVNATTDRNACRALKARSCAGGIKVDTSTSLWNLVSNFDVRSCTLGLSLGGGAPEIRDGIITGNTADVSCPLGAAGITSFNTRNVVVGVLGDLDPANGKIIYHYTTLGAGIIVAWGVGSPEGVVPGNVSSEYHRKDGGATTSLYVKTSGTGNTGWTAK